MSNEYNMPSPSNQCSARQESNSKIGGGSAYQSTAKPRGNNAVDFGFTFEWAPRALLASAAGSEDSDGWSSIPGDTFEFIVTLALIGKKSGANLG